MRFPRRRFLRLAAGAVALPAVSRLAVAQVYPSRPITIVVPFGPGSATDTVARNIALPLGVALKQNILIETKPGANGTIAANMVARAAPDGYTLILGTNTPHSAAPSLMKSISYDPVRDFAPLSRIGSFTQMLVLHPDLPVKSIPELIAHAKANPGKLSFASGNASGVVAGETLKRWAGLDIVHVPYRSAPPALNDVLGGRRVDLPAGITSFDMDSWAAMFAPANTPPEIVTRLNAELRKIIDDSDVRGRLGALGFEAFSSTPEELGEFVKVQLVKWTRMIKDAGIEPE